MKDLPQRTVTAVVFGAVVLGAGLLPWQILTALVVVTGLIAGFELFRLRRAGPPVLIQVIVLVLGLVALWIMYLVWPLTALRVGGTPIYLPLALLAILPTWAADVSGYLVGSALGVRKLVPRLSPSKTWEGTIAGFISAGMTALVVGWIESIPAVVLIPLAVVVGPVALAGDLLESWVKRRAGAKDSGRLFPGHGGMLDRIDSLLAVSLLVYGAFWAGDVLKASGMMGR